MGTYGASGARTPRTVTAIVTSAVVLVCFWAFGGVGSAGNTSSSTQYQYGNERITICHNRHRTLQVTPAELPRHLAHGDTLGKCRRG